MSVKRLFRILKQALIVGLVFFCLTIGAFAFVPGTLSVVQGVHTYKMGTCAAVIGFVIGAIYAARVKSKDS